MSTTSSPTPTADSEKRIADYGGLDAGAIVGIVIGVAAVVAIVFVSLWYRRRRRHLKTAPTMSPPKTTLRDSSTGSRPSLDDRKSFGGAGTPMHKVEDEETGQQQSLDPLPPPYTPNETPTAVTFNGKPPTGPSVEMNDLDGNRRHELSATSWNHELATDEVNKDGGSHVKYPMQAVSVSRAGTTSNNFAQVNSGSLASATPQSRFESSELA